MWKCLRGAAREFVWTGLTRLPGLWETDENLNPVNPVNPVQKLEGNKLYEYTDDICAVRRMDDDALCDWVYVASRQRT